MSDAAETPPADNETALRALIANGLTFGGALNVFAAHQRENEPELDPFIEGARELYHRDGETEIDDPGVIVSDSDEGAYVLAWVWVSNEEAGIADDEGEEV